jgi:hypothetical protein
MLEISLITVIYKRIGNFWYITQSEDIKYAFVYTSLVEIPSNSVKFPKIWFIDIQVLEFLMVHNYNFPQNSINICTGYCNSFSFSLWLYNYWEYVIECVFAVERHIILKIWLILRILKMSSCGSLSTSNIGYGDIITGFFEKLTENAKQSK